MPKNRKPAKTGFFTPNLDAYGRMLRLTVGLVIFNIGVALAAFYVHWLILTAIFALSVAALAEAIFGWSPLNAYFGIPMPRPEDQIFSSGSKRARGASVREDASLSEAESQPMSATLASASSAASTHLDRKVKSRRQDKFRKRHHFNKNKKR
ncbi:MAG: DUF2892 domain-containing protein [Candidatus Methylacidiphilales bacterium]|nr:DUF2892 domain-containing protein [Candidatus Methylacidiphilales bacterium]